MDILNIVHIGINAIVYITLWAIALFLLWHGMRMCFKFPENNPKIRVGDPWEQTAIKFFNKLIGALYLIAALISLCILKGASL